MNGTFNDAFIFIYNYFEMPSDNVCAKLCGLDYKTIASYYNKTAKEPHYKNVIAICCGFNLRPRVSKNLLSTIRIDLDISTALEDHLYNILLHTNYNESIDEWNEHIKEANIGYQHMLNIGSIVTIFIFL